MNIRFWTVLQYPYQQAVFVENKKIIKTIPDHPPKTIVRKVGCIGEAPSKLIVLRHASFELWSKDGTREYVSFHHNLIYAPHAVYYRDSKKEYIICSSGLDLFFSIDETGNTKWEWWGKKEGLGGENPYFLDKEKWNITQVTTNTAEVPIEKAAHFNSIWWDEKNNELLTAALRKGIIAKINPDRNGFKKIRNIGKIGIHSPIINSKGQLIFGTENGIYIEHKNILGDFKWIKFIREIDNKYFFTHEKGLTILDSEFKVIDTIDLPRPYQFAFLEVY